MTKSNAYPIYPIVCLLLSLLLLGSSRYAHALVTEFVPKVYVSEDYTDNYFQTKTDKIEEFYTTYGVGISLGFLEKTYQVLLSYNPEYIDYDTFNEEDTWEHNASLTGNYLPSKRSSIDFSLNYDGHGDNNESESWQHGASIGATYEISKYTGTQFSADYTNSYARQLRTQEWNESKDYSLSGGITHQFGRNDSVGFNYTWSMVDYKDADADDYEEHAPSLFLGYWFTPQWGFDSNLSYEYTVYDLSDRETKTWEGDVRLIKRLTKHFQIYGKYEHSLTQEDKGDHTVYIPSVGFDWSVTEDSGISLGVGMMFQTWDNPDESKESLFVEADAFKTINFSRRGAFTLSASSGYDATSDDAASLGSQTYYEVGFLLSYQFLKELSSQLTGSWTRDLFDDPDVNRVDDTFEMGAGLTWFPWKWMQIDLDYTYEDYQSDAPLIEDFQEHTAMVMLTLYPARPPRMISTRFGFGGEGGERIAIEREIFSDR